jgi:hypothetical protein
LDDFSKPGAGARRTGLRALEVIATDTESLPAPWSAMGYRITLDRGVLRGELFARETVEETKTFFRAMVSASSETRCPCVLISVRSSKPIFQLERHGLIEYFRKLAAVTSSRRIALLGDSRDLRLSHEYVELIARQHGLNVRSFPDETAAYQWFRDPRRERERRRQQERRSQQVLRTQQERRAGQQRRRAERRNTDAADRPAS